MVGFAPEILICAPNVRRLFEKLSQKIFLQSLHGHITDLFLDIQRAPEEDPGKKSAGQRDCRMLFNIFSEGQRLGIV